MLTHSIIAGLVPKDGIALQKALDEASAAGYVLIHTTACAIDETNAYYIATMGLPVAEPARREGIGMTGGGRKTMSPTNVPASPPAQSPHSGEGA